MTEVARLRDLAERCLTIARSFKAGGDVSSLLKIAADSLEHADRLERRVVQQQQQQQPQELENNERE